MSPHPKRTWGGGDSNENIFGYLRQVGKPDGKAHKYEYIKKGKLEDINGKQLNGKYALIERGDITFTQKFENAINAGAEGVMVFNHADGGEEYAGMAGIDNFKTFGVALKHSQGLKLVEALKKNPEETVTFTSETIEEIDPRGLQPSSFTSWGTTSNLEFKPEIAGIGGNVYSTIGESDEYGSMSGTSMASPNVAGVAALLTQHFKERYPNVTGEERVRLIKHTLMNTADIPKNEHGVPYSPRQVGAGLAKADKALRTSVTATVNGAGAVELRQINGPKTFTVKLQNRGDKDATYTIGKQQVLNENNTAGAATVHIAEDETLVANTEKVLVPAGGSAEVTFTLTPKMTRGDHFVTGWAQFTGTEGAVDLAVPYLGFAGDWNREEIIAQPGDAVWAALQQNAATRLTVQLSRFSVPIEGTRLGTLALSPNGDKRFDTLMPEMLLLRNAQSVSYEVLSGDGKTVITTLGSDRGLRRVGVKHVQGKADAVALATGDKFDGMLWNPQTEKFEPLPDGQYIYRIKARLGKDFPEQITDIKFTVDTVAPTIQLISKDKGKIVFKVQDNHGGIGVFGAPSVRMPNGLKARVTQGTQKNVFEATFAPNVNYVLISAEDAGSNEAELLVPQVDASIFAMVNQQYVPADTATLVGATASDKGFVVSGYIVNGDTAKVTVNGEQSQYKNGIFAHKLTANADMDVVIIAQNADGEEIAKQTIKVTLDKQPPKLEITGLNEKGEAALNEGDASVTLSGTLTDERQDAKLALLVNRAPVRLGADGVFNQKIKVDADTVALQVIASDGVNHVARNVPIAGRAITAAEEPEIELPQFSRDDCKAIVGRCFINRKSPGFDADAKTLTMEGAVPMPDAISEISFTPTPTVQNGQLTNPDTIKAELKGEAFRVVLPADTGINNFQTVVKGKDGKILLQNIFRVWVDVKPPQIDFVEPVLRGGTLYTNTPDVMFKGTIADDGWGHSLVLNNNMLANFFELSNYGTDANGREFAKQIKVADGDKLFVFSNDSIGNNLVGIIPVRLDQKAPTVGVDNVQEQQTLTAPTQLRVWAEDPNLEKLRVIVDGQEVYSELNELQTTKVEAVLDTPEALAARKKAKANASGESSVNRNQDTLTTTENTNGDDSGDTERKVNLNEGTLTTAVNTRLATTVDTKGMAAGVHSVTVETVDLAGNSASLTKTFVVNLPAVIEGPDTVEIQVKQGALADQDAVVKQLLSNFKVVDDGALQPGETKLSLANGVVLMPGEQQVSLLAIDADNKVVHRVVTVKITEQQPEPTPPANPPVIPPVDPPVTTTEDVTSISTGDNNRKKPSGENEQQPGGNSGQHSGENTGSGAQDNTDTKPAGKASKQMSNTGGADLLPLTVASSIMLVAGVALWLRSRNSKQKV